MHVVATQAQVISSCSKFTLMPAAHDAGPAVSTITAVTVDGINCQQISVLADSTSALDYDLAAAAGVVIAHDHCIVWILIYSL